MTTQVKTTWIFTNHSNCGSAYMWVFAKFLILGQFFNTLRASLWIYRT